MSQHTGKLFSSFASLHWYDETIKFVFNFVAKTSELLLAAGVVVSTANFLTDGDIMNHSKMLSDAWSWAQALAIDSSLGIVFMSGFQALRERDKIKAAIFFTLTAILATVAGLLTHFDSLSHATGLPITSVSHILPLWILTALRSIAVIGFLLVSRLKNFSFNQLHQELNEEPLREPLIDNREPLVPHIDYDALAVALLGAIQQTQVIEEGATQTIALLQSGANLTTKAKAKKPAGATEVETIEIRIARAYEEIKAERERNQESKPISARELASVANVRRTTCTEWLQAHSIQVEEEEQKAITQE